MEGYDVVTNDEHKVGRVVQVEDDFLVVEHGAIRKSKHAIPRAITGVDQDEECVRLSVSKDVFEEGPELDDDQVDYRATASYYGLAGGEEAPDTRGYGDVTSDDPARGAEQDAARLGLETADERRTRIRESISPDVTEGAPGAGARGIHQDYWQTKE